MIKFDDNIVYILDNVLFSDVTDILMKYSKFISSDRKSIIIDLKYLEKSNTSMLLLMINFLKLAIKKKCDITFCNVPSFLIELGRVYNLNSILYNRKNRSYYVKRKN